MAWNSKISGGCKKHVFPIKQARRTRNAPARRLGLDVAKSKEVTPACVGITECG